MKQVTITTGKVKMLVVDLPQGATLAGIVRDHLYYYSSSMTHHDYPYSEIIPDGFEGTECFQGISHITEEDWKGIVSSLSMTNTVFMDYKNKGCCLDTATESGMSLLKANGVVMANELGDYPCDSGHGNNLKNSCINSCQGSCWNNTDFDHDEWEEAQSKVWLNPQIFVKV